MQVILAENQRAQFIVQADLIEKLGPELVERLAEIMAAMKPEIAEARLYNFAGANGSGDVSKNLAQASSLGMLEQVLSSEGLNAAVSGLLKKLGNSAEAPNPIASSEPTEALAQASLEESVS